MPQSHLRTVASTQQSVNCSDLLSNSNSISQSSLLRVLAHLAVIFILQLTHSISHVHQLKNKQHNQMKHMQVCHALLPALALLLAHQLGSRQGFASSLWVKGNEIWLMMLLSYFARFGQLAKFIFWQLEIGQTPTYSVSLESSLQMQEYGVYFKLISWKLIELPRFEIWKFIYFCQILGIFSHFHND